MSVFVLVHGAWHDGSAWKVVIQHLEAKGHQAFAPTIAGHGKGVDKNVNHAQCTPSIVDYIVDKDLTDQDLRTNATCRGNSPVVVPFLRKM